ncbi:MAG: hypothetical protein AAGD13_06555 [Pseudomonadota bacterium]
MRQILALAALPFLAACNDLQPHISTVPVNAVQTIAVSGALRPGVVMNQSGRQFVCMPPPPDAGFREADTVAFDLNIAAISAGDEAGDAGAQAGEHEFLGRTPTLLLARELLFQQCLTAFNMGLSPEQVLQIQRENLTTIQSLMAAEIANTTITQDAKLSTTSTDTDTDTADETPGAPGS